MINIRQNNLVEDTKSKEMIEKIKLKADDMTSMTMEEFQNKLRGILLKIVLILILIH